MSCMLSYVILKNDLSLSKDSSEAYLEICMSLVYMRKDVTYNIYIQSFRIHLQFLSLDRLRTRIF